MLPVTRLQPAFLLHSYLHLCGYQGEASPRFCDRHSEHPLEPLRLLGPNVYVSHPI